MLAGFTGKEMIIESDYQLIFTKVLIDRNFVYEITTSAYKWALTSPQNSESFKTESKRLLSSFKFLTTSKDNLPKIDTAINWLEVITKSGNFKFLMPESPDYYASEIETELGKVPVGNYTSSSGGAVYIFAVTDMPFIITDEKIISRLYNSSTQNTLKNEKKLIQQKDFTFDGFKGRENLVEDDKFIYRSRILYYKQKVILQFVMTAKTLNLTQETYEFAVNKYFNSLQVTEF